MFVFGREEAADKSLCGGGASVEVTGAGGNGFSVRCDLLHPQTIYKVGEKSCNSVTASPLEATGAANKVCKTQLSRTQAGPCIIAKEQQKQISPNHVQAVFAGSVLLAFNGEVKVNGQELGTDRIQGNGSDPTTQNVT